MAIVASVWESVLRHNHRGDGVGPEKIGNVDAFDDPRRFDQSDCLRELRKPARGVLLALTGRLADEVSLRHLPEREDRVPEARRLLEIALLRNLMHLRLDFREHLRTLPLEKGAGLVEARTVVGGRNPAEARRRAGADHVRKAMPVALLIRTDRLAFADAIALLDEILRGTDDGSGPERSGNR